MSKISNILNKINVVSVNSDGQIPFSEDMTPIEIQDKALSFVKPIANFYNKLTGENRKNFLVNLIGDMCGYSSNPDFRKDINSVIKDIGGSGS